MIDLVTVVFKDELEILKIQAQSIDLYCNNLNLQSIYVVVNDNDCVAADIDPAWWGQLKSLVKIIPRSAFSTEYSDNGWISQQVCKILCSTMSCNTWSLVLDAKTVLVTPVELDRLIDPDGYPVWGAWTIQSVFANSQLITNRLFDINLTHCLAPAGVPFLFHNNSVRAMTEEISTRVKQDFATWFQQQELLTEFILYSGYIEYTHGSVTAICSVRPDHRPYSVCNICHSDTEHIDKKLHNMMSDKTDLLSVSVHRHAWKLFTKQQKELYRAVLLNRHITRATNIK